MNTLTCRYLLALCAATALLGLGVLTTAYAQTPTTVRFGSVGGLTDAGLYLAEELGYFKEEGLIVEMKRMASGPNLVTALATDQLDVAGIAVTPGLFTAANQGINIKIVGDKNSTRPGFVASKLVVSYKLANGSKADIIKSLKGKVIGVSAKGSSSYYVLNRIFTANGFSVNEVQAKEISYPAMIAGLASGAVDAAYILEPFLSQVLSEKIGVEVADLTTVQGERGQTGVPMVYSEKFGSNKVVAQAFMNAYMKGVRIYNDAFVKNMNKDKVIEILARRSGFALEVVKMATPAGLDPNQEVDLDSLRDMHKFFINQKFITTEANIDKLIDNSFAKASIAKYGRYK
jgi:NitT/TauT family transport system substrate-binding protein